MVTRYNIGALHCLTLSYQLSMIYLINIFPKTTFLKLLIKLNNSTPDGRKAEDQRKKLDISFVAFRINRSDDPNTTGGM